MSRGHGFAVSRFRPSKNAKKEKKRPGKKFEKGVEN